MTTDTVTLEHTLQQAVAHQQHAAQWQAFEHENPDTFGNMYQFWIQNCG